MQAAPSSFFRLESFHSIGGKNRFVSRIVSPVLKSLGGNRFTPGDHKCLEKNSYASAADRLQEHRKRQRAAKASATLPTPTQIIEREEAEEKVEQLSRAAGVPRNYPLSVWKRAAQALITGEGSVQGKVKALRSLCAVSKEDRKRFPELGQVRPERGRTEVRQGARLGSWLPTGPQSRRVL